MPRPKIKRADYLDGQRVQCDLCGRHVTTYTRISTGNASRAFCRTCLPVIDAWPPDVVARLLNPHHAQAGPAEPQPEPQQSGGIA